MSGAGSRIGARKERGQVKAHEGHARGRIARLFPGEDDYGFIETADGAEVYFHKTSVLDGRFEDLVVGADVSFVEEAGDDPGPVRGLGRL